MHNRINGLGRGALSALPNETPLSSPADIAPSTPRSSGSSVSAGSNLNRLRKNLRVPPTPPRPQDNNLDDLPNDCLVRILRHSDTSALDQAVRVSKRFKHCVSEARTLSLKELVSRPNRFSREPVPTRMELEAMGVRRPNMANILASVEKSKLLPDRPPGPFLKNLRAHAELQNKLRSLGENAALTLRSVANSPDLFDFGPHNELLQTHGFGFRLQLPDREVRYVGTFTNGKESGLGFASYENGDRYEGTFANGLPHGAGAGLYADGVKYQGCYENGAVHGKGAMSYPDGSQLVGHFNNNQPVQAMMKYASGSFYSGAWKDSMRHGQGKLLYAHGPVIEYQGAFENDAPHGQGQILFKDFTRYLGSFENGMPHGEGELSYSNGTRYRGTFTNGYVQGPCQFFDEDGRPVERDHSIAEARAGQ